MREAFGKYLAPRAIVLALGDAAISLAVLGAAVFLFRGTPLRPLSGAAAVLTLSPALVYVLFLLGRYAPSGPAPARILPAAGCILGIPAALCGLAAHGWLGLFVGLIVLPLPLWLWGLAVDLGKRKGFFSETALVVGSGRLADEINAAAALAPDIRLVPRNGNADTGHSAIHDHARRQDRLAALRRLPLLGRLIPGVLVVAADEPGATGGKRQALILSANGIPVLSGEAFYEKLTGSVLLEYLDRDPALKSGGTAGQIPTPALYDLAERGAALALLVLFSPILAATALAIKLTSPGPVFFRQDRVGKDGRPFSMIKFRSMQDNAEKGTGPVWAEKNDARVTAVGRFIRKTHVDELPQLLNVLSGRMSLVGPRPERPYFVEKLSRTIPGYDLRHLVRPGITGWAQINYSYGASQNDAREKLRYELFYIKHRSPMLDLYILLATTRTLFATSGAR